MQQAALEDPDRVPCFVRDPEHIPVSLDDTPLVRTGAAAAVLFGMPVVSEVSRTFLRVPVSADQLSDLPAALDGVRTEKAPNVVLIADPARLAAADMRQTAGGVFVAPSSRVAADLTFEPRGSSAASVFLDLWGDSIL
jgi:hypothetical protein